jgi:hypothetical protein
MNISSCAICESPLRNEIEKRDTSSKVDKTINWARSRGVNISRFSLAKHRANHIKTDNGSGVIFEIIPDTTTKTISDTKEPDDSCVRKDGNNLQQCSAIKPASISDRLFLDTIRDKVYQMLLDGKIELKVDSAFKAIEIKHKITEESQNEKMLLEILNEIRSEELKRCKHK